MKLKWLRFFDTSTIKEVEAVETWSVRWTGRNGIWGTDVIPCQELFIEEYAAKKFADSLRTAFQLLRIKGEGTEVVVSLNK